VAPSARSPQEAALAAGLSTKQVGGYLQMNDDRIYDMAKKGKLPAVRIR